MDEKQQIIAEYKQKFIEIQNSLKSKINTRDSISLSSVKTVAGVDLAYWKEKETEYAVCCIVLLDYQSHQVVEQSEYTARVEVPYIPGCLAFRELPLFLQADKKLSCRPDLYFFDGNGYLHPRHMGLACHAGIMLDKPAIGVAKSYYKIEDTDFVMPEDKEYAYTDIQIRGEVYGRALRTHKGVKPVFVSVGNQIDLDTATTAVCQMTTWESHIPMPTRLADLMTHEARQRLFKTVAIV